MPADLDVDLLRAASRVVVDHHHALRLAVSTAGSWSLRVLPVGSVDGGESVQVVDAAGHDNLSQVQADVTSAFPMRIDVGTESGSPVDRFRDVLTGAARARAAVPNAGIGFGLLTTQMSDPYPNLIRGAIAQVSVNYLGEADASTPGPPLAGL